MALPNKKQKRFILVLSGDNPSNFDGVLEKIIGGRTPDGRCKVTFSSVAEAVEEMNSGYTFDKLCNKRAGTIYDTAEIYPVGRDRVYKKGIDPVRLYRLRWGQVK